MVCRASTALLRPGVAPQATPVQIVDRVRASVKPGNNVPERPDPPTNVAPRRRAAVGLGWPALHRERAAVRTATLGVLKDAQNLNTGNPRFHWTRRKTLAVGLACLLAAPPKALSRRRRADIVRPRREMRRRNNPIGVLRCGVVWGHNGAGQHRRSHVGRQLRHSIEKFACRRRLASITGRGATRSPVRDYHRPIMAALDAECEHCQQRHHHHSSDKRPNGPVRRHVGGSQSARAPTLPRPNSEVRRPGGQEEHQGASNVALCRRRADVPSRPDSADRNPTRQAHHSHLTKRQKRSSRQAGKPGQRRQGIPHRSNVPAASSGGDLVDRKLETSVPTPARQGRTRAALSPTPTHS